MRKFEMVLTLFLALVTYQQTIAQTKLAKELYAQQNQTHESVSVMLRDRFDEIDLTSMSDLGVLFWQDSDYVSASECYKMALKKVSHKEYAYHKLTQQLALAYGQMGKDTLAITTIEDCIALCQNDDWRIMLEAGYGQLLYDMGDYPKSAAHYLVAAIIGEQQKIKDSELGELYCFAAQSYMLSYDFKVAERCARRAVVYFERDFSADGDSNYAWGTKTLRYALQAQYLTEKDERTNIVFVEQ